MYSLSFDKIELKETYVERHTKQKVEALVTPHYQLCQCIDASKETIRLYTKL